MLQNVAAVDIVERLVSEWKGVRICDDVDALESARIDPD
jgi:hypothetical protein